MEKLKANLLMQSCVLDVSAIACMVMMQPGRGFTAFTGVVVTAAHEELHDMVPDWAISIHYACMYFKFEVSNVAHRRKEGNNLWATFVLQFLNFGDPGKDNKGRTNHQGSQAQNPAPASCIDSTLLLEAG